MRAFRGIVITLALVGLLIGGLYYADSRFHTRAERETAADLQTQLGTPEPPTVTIEGWPFLTQVAAGSFRTVRVEAAQLGATNEAPLTVQQVSLVLSDVRSDDRFQTMVISHVEGTGLLDYASLQRLAGVPLAYVGGGRVQITQTTTVFGQSVEAKIAGTLRLQPADQTVTLVDPTITVANVTLPAFTADALLKALLKPIKITGLPYDLRVSAIQPADDGLHADIVGDGITITR